MDVAGRVENDAPVVSPLKLAVGDFEVGVVISVCGLLLIDGDGGAVPRVIRGDIRGNCCTFQYSL